MAKINTSEVRKINKKSILRYLLKNEEATKPQIAIDLKLSIPTVGLIVDELVQQGLVENAGVQASSGGRRAAVYRVIKDSVHACGIEISQSHQIYVIVNICGEIVASERISKPFSDDREYINDVEKYREDFVRRSGVDPQTVVGAGISVQGLINADQTSFSSHMLDNQRKIMIMIYPLTDKFPYIYLNDGTASCMSECYANQEERDFVYLMLSRTVGGAIVENGDIWQGVDSFAGEFGHMCIHPGDDKVCYCGGKGHAWCYLSSDRLEEICDGPYWNFFTQLETGDPDCRKFFERFLDDLALLVYNVRMMHNSDVVLGGYLGTHLRPYLPDLEKRLQKLDHLYLESKTKVLIGQYDLEAAGVGAARYFIEQFIVSLS
ncbi:MAG: ROK family transcriptional regulator [Solobacterium sp.]|nr:ROK family transcriptional regulator [Solobacterium sp.]